MVGKFTGIYPQARVSVVIGTLACSDFGGQKLNDFILHVRLNINNICVHVLTSPSQACTTQPDTKVLCV